MIAWFRWWSSEILLDRSSSVACRGSGFGISLVIICRHCWEWYVLSSCDVSARSHTLYAVNMVICLSRLPCKVISVQRPIPLGSVVDVAFVDHGCCIIMHVPPGRYDVLVSSCVQDENW